MKNFFNLKSVLLLTICSFLFHSPCATGASNDVRSDECSGVSKCVVPFSLSNNYKFYSSNGLDLSVYTLGLGSGRMDVMSLELVKGKQRDEIKGNLFDFVQLRPTNTKTVAFDHTRIERGLKGSARGQDFDVYQSTVECSDIEISVQPKLREKCAGEVVNEIIVTLGATPHTRGAYQDEPWRKIKVKINLETNLTQVLENKLLKPRAW